MDTYLGTLNIGEVTLWGMPIEVILIAWLVLANLCQSIGHWIEKSVWARERRELYSRIQAGTLRDYAAYAPLVEATPSNGQKAASVLQEPGSGAYNVSLEGLGKGDLIAGQSSYNALMGD